MQFDQVAALQRCHAVGGEPDTYGLDFGHRFEHLHDALRRHAGDDAAAPGAKLDEAARRQLTQRFTNRRAGGAETIGKLLFIQRCARRQRAGGDLVGQGVANAVGEQPAIIAVILGFKTIRHSVISDLFQHRRLDRSCMQMRLMRPLSVYTYGITEVLRIQ